MKRKLRKEVKYGLYALSFISICGLIYSIEKTLFPLTFKDRDPYDYVGEIIFPDAVPVSLESDVFGRPYNVENISIVKNFYDYKADSELQEKSLIYSDGTYIQSTGISYSNGDIFDVISILDGTVIDVKENDLLGKIVEIRHTNDIISVYQSLSEVNVNINDVVTKGMVLGKSGNSNIAKDEGNHVYFELIIGGINVNPESYYDKKISDI